jgi:hypothetical protein
MAESSLVLLVALTVTVCAFIWVKIVEVWTKIVREIAYDAVCYATEASTALAKKGERVTSEEKLNLAVSYYRMVMPCSTRKRAIRYCTSILAKVVNVGASGSQKL